MKFEDTKLLNHPEVRMAFEHCAQAFVDIPIALDVAVLAGEMLSQSMTDKNPHLIAATLLAQAHIRGTLSPKEIDPLTIAYIDDYKKFLYSMDDDRISRVMPEALAINVAYLAGTFHRMGNTILTNTAKDYEITAMKALYEMPTHPELEKIFEIVRRADPGIMQGFEQSRDFMFDMTERVFGILDDQSKVPSKNPALGRKPKP